MPSAAAQPHLDAVGALLALARELEPATRGVAVFGVDEVEHVGADERLDVEPEDPLGDRARVHEPAVGIDDRHDVVGVADHGPEAGLVALEEVRHLVDGAGGPPAHDARRDDRQHDDRQEQAAREDALGTHVLSVGIRPSRP